MHELGFAVVTAAKQDRDDGEVAARLDDVLYDPAVAKARGV
jgi:hypothetical protein